MQRILLQKSSSSEESLLADFAGKGAPSSHRRPSGMGEAENQRLDDGTANISRSKLDTSLFDLPSTRPSLLCSVTTWCRVGFGNLAEPFAGSKFRIAVMTIVRGLSKAVWRES
jgi:hypothetical protein